MGAARPARRTAKKPVGAQFKTRVIRLPGLAGATPTQRRLSPVYLARVFLDSLEQALGLFLGHLAGGRLGLLSFLLLIRGIFGLLILVLFIRILLLLLLLLLFLIFLLLVLIVALRIRFAVLGLLILFLLLLLIQSQLEVVLVVDLGRIDA